MTSTYLNTYTEVESTEVESNQFVYSYLERLVLLSGQDEYNSPSPAIIKAIQKLYDVIEKNMNIEEYLSQKLALLSEIYVFRRSPEVKEFLTDNIYLISLVVDAYEKIGEYFPQATLILEVVSDPEDNTRELVIFIHTDLPPDDALNRLEQLDENWWLKASLDAGGKLCIHIEFK